MAEATKTCPACAEEILAVAKKCRHCGEFFDGTTSPSRLVTTHFAPCPSCGERVAEAVTFSWWGGLIGPKLLSHVKCRACSTTYNGKTGRSNTLGIVIYTVVLLVISLGFLAFLALAW